MTRSIPRASALALGVAAFVSLSSLSARAEMSGAPASSAAAPSLAEPAPTPAWAESGPGGPTAEHPTARLHARHYARHYAARNARRYAYNNPVATVATGVVGGVADLGSIAAYPFYCFPNYGACSMRVPYRF